MRLFILASILALEVIGMVLSLPRSARATNGSPYCCSGVDASRCSGCDYAFSVVLPNGNQVPMYVNLGVNSTYFCESIEQDMSCNDEQPVDCFDANNAPYYSDANCQTQEGTAGFSHDVDQCELQDCGS